MARRRCHGHDAGYQRGAKRIAEPYSLLVLELRPLGRRSNYGDLPTTADLANPSISTTSIATSTERVQGGFETGQSATGNVHVPGKSKMAGMMTCARSARSRARRK